MFCFNDRSLEKFIQFIDQQPCAPIRHVHRAPCCRNGPVVADRLEQPDLAVTDRPSRAEIETQCEPRHQGSLADRTGGRSHPRNEPADLTSIYFDGYIVEAIVYATPAGGRRIEMTTIRAKHLTTFSVAPDGRSVAIGVADEEGQSAALMLPAECLKSLIMTLPDMMRRALRLQHGDPSLRLVYPVAGWEIEHSTRPEIRIVTLRTSDGFHVSFGIAAKDLREMSEAGADRMLH